MTSSSHSADKPRTLIYNLLLNMYPMAQKTRFSATVWNLAWRRLTTTHQRSVETKIHGTKVLINQGYTYPLFTRQFSRYNQPLVEIVHQAAKALGRPIVMVDVGAAIGDTVILIDANCPSSVAHYHCVDGSPDFFSYLTHNLGQRSDCSLYHVVLSSHDEQVAALVHTHQGTASAQGDAQTQATSLDTLLDNIDSQIDVIKVDVDGYDGRVLAGATKCLAAATAVIFEWHPILLKQTGNEWLEPFKILESAKFSRFVWYTKFGDFSHTHEGVTVETLNMLAEYCLSDISDDWHWDVIALRSDTPVDVVGLARMNFAKHRPSRF